MPQQNQPLSRTLYAAAVLLLALIAPHLRAAQTYQDIQVSVLRQHSHETMQGYAEYVFQVTNLSPENTHKVTIGMPDDIHGWGDHIERITRTVNVMPGATVQVPLYQPPLPLTGTPEAYVVIDNNRQENPVGLLQNSHARSNYGRSTRNVCLLIGQDLNKDDLENVITPAVLGLSGQAINPPGGSHRAHSSPPKPVDIFKSHIPVDTWSTNWLAYSAYSGIILTDREVQRMSPAIHAALRNYVHAGGSLLILGPSVPQAIFQNTQPTEMSGMFTVYQYGWGVIGSTPHTGPHALDVPTWQHVNEHFWEKTHQQQNRDMRVEEANRWFPVIDELEIPVRGLFMIVLLFVILMGPLNIFVLSRKKRRIWLLWTVPAISLVAAMAVFSYATFAEGFRPYGRMLSMTILDERTNHGSSLGIVAFYCPMTPQEGLHFDYSTVVTPINTTQWNRQRGRSVDWTNDQHLRRGWIYARIPSHFLIRNTQQRRERVQIQANGSTDPPTAVNGLGTDIQTLWYADEKGKIFKAENIRAGERAALESTELFSHSDSAAPDLRTLYASPWDRSYSRIVENFDRYLRPNTYIALVNEPVFIETGLKSFQRNQVESLVIGIRKGTREN